MIPRGIFRDASLEECAGQGCAWAQQQCGALAQGFGHLYVVLVESASTRYSFCPPFLSFWYQDGLSRTSKRYWRVNSGAAVPSQPPSRLTGGGQCAADRKQPSVLPQLLSKGPLQARAEF